MKIFCSKDCPDLCAIEAQENNGKFTFKGIAEDYAETGFVCSKFRVFAEREINSGLASYARYGKEFVSFKSEADAANAAADLLSLFKNKKILYLRGSGSLAYNMGWWDTFISRFENVYKISGGVCDNTGDDAHEHDFGTGLNPPVTNLESADTVILFGKNAAVVSQHLYAYLKKLKESGKNLVYIDPIKTKTAEIADRYIQIRPASDGLLAYALLCGLGHETCADVQEYLTLSGVSNDDFNFLLNRLKKPAAFIEGFGMQRHSNGMNIIRLINRLAVKTGNIDRLYYGHGSKRYWQPVPSGFNNCISIENAAKKLAEGGFDFFVNIAANPAMTYPDADNWFKGIKRTPTLVADVCHTRTSENCILFLKVGGMFAQKDFMASYFFEHDHSRERMIPGMSDMDAVRLMSGRLGFSVDFKEPERITPGKRVYRDESIRPVLPEVSHRLQIFSGSNHRYLNSQITDGLEKGLQVIMLNKKDAEKYGVSDKDPVRVRNEHGSFTAEAEITDRMPEGVAMCWKNLPMKNGIFNSIVPPRLTDSGSGMVYYSVFADIEKI